MALGLIQVLVMWVMVWSSSAKPVCEKTNMELKNDCNREKKFLSDYMMVSIWDTLTRTTLEKKNVEKQRDKSEKEKIDPQVEKEKLQKMLDANMRDNQNETALAVYQQETLALYEKTNMQLKREKKFLSDYMVSIWDTRKIDENAENATLPGLAAAAQDVTGNEPLPYEATPMTEENINNIAGTKTRRVRQATDLSKAEIMDVVTIAFQPVTSVVEWTVEQDMAFRTAISKILTSTIFSMSEESDETTKTLNVTADQVLYVAPSPQMTEENRLLVSFLVLDKEKVTPRHHSVLSGINARQRRETNSTGDSLTGYLPSVWVVQAIHYRLPELEEAVNQTVDTVFGGVIPRQLLSLEQIAATSLFERHLDIFIPLILVAVLVFMGLAVSLVYIRAKKRSMTTRGPPAASDFILVKPLTY